MSTEKSRATNKITMNNRVVGYPSTRIKKIIVAISFDKKQKVSETAVKAFRTLVDSYSEKEQTRLLALYETLTPEEKSHPHLKKC